MQIEPNVMADLVEFPAHATLITPAMAQDSVGRYPILGPVLDPCLGPVALYGHTGPLGIYDADVLGHHLKVELPHFREGEELDLRPLGGEQGPRLDMVLSQEIPCDVDTEIMG